ncbi:hypothetical protein E2542_SST25564 [Spatholobus suberectus]|nr:hypothetical protein E2542_SST25564 [Spatholobus suberectus]
MTRLKMPSWRTFWRKIKREKRRLFSSSTEVHVQYDPSSYSQNFDDGYSTDPDNLSRSFSARFAVPSKIFEKSDEMVLYFRIFLDHYVWLSRKAVTAATMCSVNMD